MDIIDLGWPFVVRREPVFASQRGVAETAKLDAVAPKLPAVAAHEAASVDEQQAGPVRLRWTVQVPVQNAIVHPEDADGVNRDPITLSHGLNLPERATTGPTTTPGQARWGTARRG